MAQSCREEFFDWQQIFYWQRDFSERFQKLYCRLHFRGCCRQKRGLPIDAIDVDAMKMKGTYFTNQPFTDKGKFLEFIESNSVFGTSLSKNFYFYSIARQYAAKMKPISFHKKNFPNATSMVAICTTRFLIISRNPKDMEEKKNHFSSTRRNGLTLIDIDEDQSSEDDIYERPSTEQFKLEYASGDDESVRQFTPGMDDSVSNGWLFQYALKLLGLLVFWA